MRDGDGTVYVLEDNLRVPSRRPLHAREPAGHQAGLRRPVQRPDIHPVDGYPDELHELLAVAGPARAATPDARGAHPRHLQLGLLRARLPGPADGCDLVEGSDLVVDDDDSCYMRTIDGPARVDVIYRRIDDLFLDPEAFRPDSRSACPA